MKQEKTLPSKQPTPSQQTIFEQDIPQTERNALLKAILEAQQIGKIGTWVFHINQDALYWSDELYRFLGISPGEPPTIEKYMKVIHPDDRRKVAEGMAKAMQGELYSSEQRILRADGQKLVVLSTARLIYDELGRPLRIVGVVQDITERKRAEEDVKRYQNHLEELVAERTIELALAKQEAERANQAKSDFLSSMSHELRTPLNGILGYTQILKRGPTLSASQKNGLLIIHQSSHHLLTLINDILDISKIEAGKIELYPQNVHLSSFLASVMGIIRMRAYEKDLLFVHQADERLPTGLQADEKRLRQVLINLLGNAVKFTKQGKVTLKVSLRGESQNDHLTLRFEIIDTGVGMTPEQLKKIFLPFEQVGDAEQRAQGTGLGLAISRQLVELMGGKLHVTSQLGKGSRFWFDLRLPLAEGAMIEEAASPQKQITGYKGKTLKLLVADDQEQNRSLLRDLLTPLGFNVYEAKDGEQEVELARHIKPDLILTDLVMPVMNGFQAIKVIRQFDEAVPIIAISASVFDSEHLSSIEHGSNAFLPKPVELQKLLALIETQLDIEWQYEESRTTGKQRQERPLLPPPQQALEMLYEFASLGMISEIRKKLDKIEEMDAKYTPFVLKVRQLNRRFEDEKILTLLEEYLELKSQANLEKNNHV